MTLNCIPMLACLSFSTYIYFINFEISIHHPIFRKCKYKNGNIHGVFRFISNQSDSFMPSPL